MFDVKLRDLPGRLVELIQRDRFLFAYSLPEKARFVAQHVRADGRKEELEFDLGLGRTLTPDERARELPGAGRETLADEDVTVVSRYFIDEPTSELRVQFDVLDSAGAKILSITKAVYDPTPWDRVQVIREALRRLRFPSEYARWPRQQKVAHWAVKLHRLRRAHGESGEEEDEIYSPGLIRDMERTDPQVRGLLREILTLVGEMEQTPPDVAIAAFTARTGIPLEPATGEPQR